MRNSGFFLNTLKLLTSQAATLAISLLSVPVLTRIYGPVGLGIMAIFMGVLGVLGPFTHLRYGNAVLLPEHEEDAVHLVVLSAIVIIVSTMLFYLTVLLFADTILQVDALDQIKPFLHWFPLGIFLLGVYPVLSSWGVRSNDFTWLGVAHVAQSFFAKGIAIALGLLKGGQPIFLISASLVGYLIASLLLTWRMFRSKNKILWTRISRRKMSAMARRYSSFARYSSADLINNLSSQLPPIILGSVFGVAAAGYYAVGSRLVGRPLMMFGVSISRSFLQEAVKRHRSGLELGAQFEKLFKQLLGISIVPLFLLGIVADEVVVLLCGQEWLPAGTYLRVFSLYFLVRFLRRPFNVILDIQERQRERFIISSLNLCWGLTLLLAWYWPYEIQTFLVLFVAGDSLIHILTIGWLLKSAGVSYMATMRTVIFHVLWGVFFGFSAWGLKEAWDLGQLASVGWMLSVLSGYTLFVFVRGGYANAMSRALTNKTR